MSRRDRASGIELTRIIAVIWIIAGHYVQLGGGTGDSLASNVFLSFLVSGHGMGVCFFFLVSGYFGQPKDCIELDDIKKCCMKIVSQWKEVFFYSFFIALLFWITGTSIFSASELVKSVFPVVCGGWTYVSIYFAVLFFTPILNVILDKISFESGVLYLAVGVLLFSILPIVTTVEIWYSYLIWGMYLYILGGFIRKYNDRLLKAKRVFMMLLLLSVLIIAASVVVIGYLKDAGISIPYEVYILTRKNSPFALLGAVSALLISSSFKQSIAIVNRVASHVFGIYLIHTNRLVTDWLYEDVLRCSQVMGNTKIVHAIISVAAVFIVCLLIDVIREFIFTGTSKLRNSFEKT